MFVFRKSGDSGASARSGPPVWLLAVLGVCLLAILIYFFSHGGPDATQAAQNTPPPATEAPVSPTPEPTPAPEPTPTPIPEPDYTKPLAAGEAAGPEWFDDAVFIGDSRTEGFKLFAGVPQANYLSYTGITAFEVMEGKPVIRWGEEKLSVLDALARGSYGKVYLGLGINELGYYDPQGYGEVFGQLVDAVRACQPDARIYIESIIPVNEEKCAANGIPDYVSNAGVESYNAALYAMAAEKKVPILELSEVFLDENGLLPREITTDGVHFQKEGYEAWRDYLMTHTGQ